MKHGGKRANAGRPRAGRVNFTVRVTPEVAAVISRLAFLAGKSLGEVVEEMFTGKTGFTER